ncbi:DNA-directed RNA polymerase subunit RPC12/RpoP [Methanofollis sp. W23]|uniref:hypothetical protein n=1 Tax=Methanofollis sp. W23 TaxID=2817849 RepID=UPI001AE82952|nr:hypothetical protein [Methanofollis sp. W23]MBP2147227.1 DNA-directed RNA polymerase subunit RPC12/RpoP [Methanofollis sp. W23]
MNAQTRLTNFDRLFLPREEVVWIRCCRCGHEETRCIDQAGLRCPECGGCVSVVSDARRRNKTTDRIAVLRYWKQGQLDPVTVQNDDDPARALP